MAYATRADVEAIWSAYGIIARIDDDESGDESAAETVYFDRLLESGKNWIDVRLRGQYTETELADTQFIVDVNAIWTSIVLSTRRGNPIPPSLQTIWQDFYVTTMDDLAAGKIRLPGQAVDVGDGGAPLDWPTMTNYSIDLRTKEKIRRVQRTSTGPAVPQHLKQNPELTTYYGFY